MSFPFFESFESSLAFFAFVFVAAAASFLFSKRFAFQDRESGFFDGLGFFSFSFFAFFAVAFGASFFFGFDFFQFDSSAAIVPLQLLSPLADAELCQLDAYSDVLLAL